MFVVTMESESTSWVALGNTEREAKEAIADEWNRRQRNLVQSGWVNEPEYMNAAELDEYYGMCICEMNPGQCETW
jgi:hypothetical protein